MTLNSYTLSFKISFLMILGAGISIIILVFTTFIFFKENIENELKNTSQSNAVVIEKIINDLQVKATQISILISNMEMVKQAYRNPDSKAGAEYLMNNFKPILENLKKTARVDKIEIHFHKPKAISFLRVWTNKSGDDLSKFRKTILEVERTKMPIMGIELGVGGFAIRGLAPIFDDGKYVGSCEMFYNPIDVFNFLSLDKEKAGALFLVDEKKSSELLESKVIEENYPGRNSGLLISKFSNEKIKTSNFLNNSFFESLDKTKSTVIEINNFAITNIPINDFSGNHIGYFVLVNNVESIHKDLYYRIFLIFIVFSIIFTIINVSTLIIIQKIVFKPITLATEMAKKIAKGDLNL